MRIFIFLFLIGFCHQSCVIKKFVRKEMQVDLLPEFISSDSISVLEPAFSGHLSSSYDDIGVALPVLSGKQNVFKSEVEQLLHAKYLDIRSIFVKSSNCLQYKMNPENWRDDKWTLFETYRCLKIDSLLYTILFYNRFDIIQPIDFSNSLRNSTNLHTHLFVFHRNRIVYTRSFRYSMVISHREHKLSRSRNIYPYFSDNQVKYVVEKVTEDLFKRIRNI